MALSKHVAKGNENGDKFSPQDHLDKPFIINPTERIPAFPTLHKKKEDIVEGEDFYLKVNLYDLENDKVYGNVILFNKTLFDQLKQHLNEDGTDASVIRFVDRTKKDGSGKYRSVDAGSDEDYEAAAKVDWETAFAERLAELKADSKEEPEAKATRKPSQSAAQKAKVEGAFTRS